MTVLPPLATPCVSLHDATESDAPLLRNLLQLYIHDLSAIFTHVELGEDGRYAYPALSSFLSGGPERCAFVLRADGRLAGFMLAQRGSPAVCEPGAWDVAEFFVLKRHRRAGVGRMAASRLWEQRRAAWTVRVANKNASALAFWRRVVADYRAGTVSELSWSPGEEPWTVFHLQPNE